MKKYPTYKELFKRRRELENELYDIKSNLDKIAELAHHGWYDISDGIFDEAKRSCNFIKEIAIKNLDRIDEIVGEGE